MFDQLESRLECRMLRCGLRCGLLLVLLSWYSPSLESAERFSESFESGELSSLVEFSSSSGEVLLHRRESGGGVDSSGCERVVIRTNRLGTRASWGQPIPESRVVDELSVSVWVWSRSPGVQLSVRVVYPHQKDPVTGRVLSDLVPGPRVTRSGRWQRLTLDGFGARLRERLVLLRARLKRPSLEGRDAYIDRVVLSLDPDPGPTEWLVDDLRVGPIVAPRPGVVPELFSADLESAGRRGSPGEVHLDRFQVNDLPFLPRVVVHRGESLEVLRSSGVNLVHVSDYRDRALIDRLRTAGLWAMAVPPRPPTVDGVVAGPGRLGLVPIGVEADGILCWYLDPSSTVSSHLDPVDDNRGGWESLMHWVGQLRVADRRMRRPILADVMGMEHMVSRQRLLPLISREVIGTGLPLKLHQQWLEERRSRGRPGSLAFSWVQVDSDSVVIEPEQIELQVRSALSAGYRGVGFRTSGRLDSDAPAAAERLLMLGLVNLELDLLESFLATSTRIGRLPVIVGRRDESAGLSGSGAGLASRSDGGSDGTSGKRSESEGDRVRRRRRVVATHPALATATVAARIDRRVQAVLFGTDYGQLLLTTWMGDNDQFVPGQMALADVSVVVPGGDETATAWEVTTTGLRSVATRRVAGGVVLEIGRFDRRSNIVLTSDPRVVSQLRLQIARRSSRAARMVLQLAQARFDRVREVDRSLIELGHAQPDASQLMTRAASFLSRAAALLGRGESNVSRLYSDATLQTLRILQRAHWEHAVRESATPVASTSSRCFQTLPEHWELAAAVVGSGSGFRPRLLGGDFEDLEGMIRAGWSSQRAAISGMTMAAEVYRGSRGRDGERGSCLRLLAVSDLRASVPTRLPQYTVIVDSPSVSVSAGELVRITGRIRLVSARPGSLDGGVLEDTLGGPAARLHCRRTGGWRRFELLRRAERGGDVRLRVALEGLGELRVDDLQIEVLSGGLARQLGSPTVEFGVERAGSSVLPTGRLGR